MTDTRESTQVPGGQRVPATTKRATGPRGIARLGLFYRQIMAELRKVVRPTRRELVTYWTVVVTFVLVVIAYVAGLDSLFSRLILAVFG